MTVRHPRVNVKAYDSIDAAEATVRELKSVGFFDSQIGLILHGGRLKSDSYNTSGRLICGTWWDLPLLAGIVPGMGPVMACGILCALFWCTMKIGAAGALIAVGLTFEEAEFYEEQFNMGKCVVVVCAGTRADIAHSVLNRFEAMQAV